MKTFAEFYLSLELYLFHAPSSLGRWGKATSGARFPLIQSSNILFATPVCVYQVPTNQILIGLDSSRYTVFLFFSIRFVVALPIYFFLSQARDGHSSAKKFLPGFANEGKQTGKEGRKIKKVHRKEGKIKTLNEDRGSKEKQKRNELFFFL